MRITVLSLFAFAAISAQAGGKFSVTSAEIKAGSMIAMDQVFDGFGCTGKNVSPSLKFSNIPAGTKALAVTMYDPDAPTGSGWWHWMVYNIPADTTELAAGAGTEDGSKLPKGSVQVKTDFGKPGYGGPCPPPGAPHRYIFKVFAQKELLNLDAGASPAMVGFNLNANLGVAELKAKFGRKK
ncbi:MAG: YbhB/YbcL family Raf kinase inhibitor-like protein [Bdellovibrionales bacterium]|nr:YbhB/YbcL family Raf kinase inhibitor-like protein [Bdellovibrionales bacterium]